MANNIDSIERIRGFFNYKCKHLGTDKLSLAYMTKNISSSELQAYIRKNFPEDNTNDYHLSCDHLKAMFQAYCQAPKRTPNLNFPKANGSPKSSTNIIKYIYIDIVKWFCLYTWHNVFPLIFNPATFIGIIIGLTGLSLTANEAERQTYIQALESIANTNGGSDIAKKEALEYLSHRTNVNPLQPEFTPSFRPRCKTDNRCLLGVRLRAVNLNGVYLYGADLRDSEFKDSSFRLANLTEAKFGGANLVGSIFDGANLTRTDFKNAKGVHPKAFVGARFCNTKMPDGHVEVPDCRE